MHHMQVRVMVHGKETVLGDAASDHELFLTNVLYRCPAAEVIRKRKAEHLKVSPEAVC
jgi:hypothetical protein